MPTCPESTLPRCDDPEALFGRDALLATLESLLARSARNRVVVLHGEAGVGKSAASRVLAARWGAEGHSVEVAGAVGAPRSSEMGQPRLVVIDLMRSAPDPSPAAWQVLLDCLGAGDRLLVVARAPQEIPVDDARLVEVRVPPLGDADAADLLGREGVAWQDRPALVRWAGGSPLKLVFGAQAALQLPGWVPGEEPEPAALTERLGRRLGDFGRAPAPPRDDVVDVSVTLAAAEHAVRNYRSAAHLAKSPLARGATTIARAAHVRTLVDAAIEAAFDASCDDASLREVLVAGYITGDVPLERIALELFMSRSTYFRKLASALRRVAAELVAAESCAGSAGPALSLAA